MHINHQNKLSLLYNLLHNKIPKYSPVKKEDQGNIPMLSIFKNILIQEKEIIMTRETILVIIEIILNLMHKEKVPLNIFRLNILLLYSRDFEMFTIIIKS